MLRAVSDMAQRYGHSLHVWRHWAADLRRQPIDAGHHVAEDNSDDLTAALFANVGDRAPVYTRLLDRPGGFAVQLATALAEELTEHFTDGHPTRWPSGCTQIS